MPNEIDTALRLAIKGLLYMSETDAPFELIHWPDGTASLDFNQVLQFSGHKPKEPITTISVDDFFKPLIEDQPWFGTVEKSAARKYRNLREIIRQQLTKTQVFRIGKIQVDILIVGKSVEGDWAGIRTRAVET